MACGVVAAMLPHKPLVDAAKLHSTTSWLVDVVAHVLHSRNLHNVECFVCTNGKKVLLCVLGSGTDVAHIGSDAQRHAILPAQNSEMCKRKGKTLFMAKFSINLLHFMLRTFHISALSFLSSRCGRSAAAPLPNRCDGWRVR